MTVLHDPRARAGDVDGDGDRAHPRRRTDPARAAAAPRDAAGRTRAHAPGLALGLGLLLFAILALIGLHGVEIWIYGFLYLAIGAIGELREAVYFSTITYGAIGYDDDVMAPEWRLVSAIEGINGIIMIGWSTAFLIRVVGLLRRV
jgi:hypothetical protein